MEQAVQHAIRLEAESVDDNEETLRNVERLAELAQNLGLFNTRWCFVSSDGFEDPDLERDLDVVMHYSGD